MAVQRSGSLAWKVEAVAGSFRGPRLVAVGAVAATFALAVLVSLAQAGVSQRNWSATVDMEDVRAPGPFRLSVFIDTRGAQLRIRTQPSREIAHGGWVGDNAELGATFIAGLDSLHVRLIAPSGEVWSRRDAGPGDRASIDELLNSEGIWRLEVSSRNARGMSTNIGVYSLSPQSALAFPQPAAALVLVLLCAIAMVVAPRPPRGARASGILLGCLAASVPFLFLLGGIIEFPGRSVPVALLSVAAFAGAAVLGWSFPRRSIRRGPAVAAGVLLAAAVILAIAAAPGAEAFAEGFMGLMNRERYDEAGRLAVFSGVPILLWLAGILVGLASAPFRRSAMPESRVAQAWAQALDRGHLVAGAGAAIGLMLGLAWSLTEATAGHPWGQVLPSTGVADLLAVWIGLLGVALVGMCAGRRGVKVAGSVLLLAAVSAPFLVPTALGDDYMLPPYPYGASMPPSTIVLTVCCLALGLLAGLLRGWTIPSRSRRHLIWVDAALVVCAALGIWALDRIAGLPHSGERPGLPQDALVGLEWLAMLVLLIGLWAVIGLRVGRRTSSTVELPPADDVSP